jgi:hypothetical protein
MMDDQMDDRMDDQMDNRMDDSMDDSMDDPMDDSMDDPMDDQMDDPMDDQMDNRMDDPMDDSMDDSMDDQMDDQMDDRMDDQMDDHSAGVWNATLLMPHSRFSLSSALRRFTYSLIEAFTVERDTVALPGFIVLHRSSMAFMRSRFSPASAMSLCIAVIILRHSVQTVRL